MCARVDDTPLLHQQVYSVPIGYTKCVGRNRSRCLRGWACVVVHIVCGVGGGGFVFVCCVSPSANSPPRLLIPCARMSLPNIQSRCSPGCLSEPMISSHRACSAHLPRSGVCGFSVCLVRAFVCVPAPFYVYSILLASSSCMLLFLLFLFRCTAPTMFLRRICCIVLCWAQCCSYYGVSHTP